MSSHERPKSWIRIGTIAVATTLGAGGVGYGISGLYPYEPLPETQHTTFFPSQSEGTQPISSDNVSHLQIKDASPLEREVEYIPVENTGYFPPGVRIVKRNPLINPPVA